MSASTNVRPMWRVAAMLAALLSVTVLSRWLTGEWIPAGARDTAVFQIGLLMIVLGSTLVEHHFTKPADALINSLTGLLALLPLHGQAPNAGWWLMVVSSGALFTAALLSVSLGDVKFDDGTAAFSVRRGLYDLATKFGSARFYFSAVFLFALWSFYSLRDTGTAVLVTVWGLYIALTPLRLPQALVNLTRKRAIARASGTVARVESPNLLRVTLSNEAGWQGGTVHLVRLADGSAGAVLPLHSEQASNGRVGTGIFVPLAKFPLQNAETNATYLLESLGEEYQAAVSGQLRIPAGATVLGTVVEGSEIGTLLFEIWRPDLCTEGMVVQALVGDRLVCYQVLGGEAQEESVDRGRRGFHVATAAQLGVYSPTAGFSKAGWLPAFNSPVFTVADDFGVDAVGLDAGQCLIGHVPSTKLPVVIDVAEALTHHTAILGVTGSGKTELAFDLIREAVRSGTKVVCIDLTARYEGRLADLTPRSLSIEEKLAKDLSDKLFAVETGEFKASTERKALEAFAGDLRRSVAHQIQQFLETADDANRVGVVTLPEISNTKATLFISELYLSLLLRYAKNKGKESPSILIVLEEAHTVIPEANTMGLGDHDSRGLVAKMGQIALQGRKYRVGLLVIAQRTATVSKTILTQCNTIISFACIDDTSITFLSNVFGSTYARMLPNLARLQALAYGKALRSQRPLLLQVPFNQAKADIE